MQSLIPNTIWGWLGLALGGFVIAIHRKLGILGLIIGLAGSAYLYFVLDVSNTSSTSS